MIPSKTPPDKSRTRSLKVKELCVFAVLASLTLSSQLATMSIPGVQTVGLFTATMTVAYRGRALIPIYVYVLLYCIIFPTLFSVPYFYIWLPMWGMFMAAAKAKIPKKVRVPLYMLLCGLHGLSFGVLYAPFQVLIMGWDLNKTLIWIKMGFVFDVSSAITNFSLGLLILPLSELLKKLDSHSFD
ncbi:MAG: hypothetical protein FWF82_06730 [Oscillospiraceae bacterium]|nr:hypothetical protein [Oscillospiraceae bacterium]